MEEPTSGNSEVACSEKICESEFNAEKTLSCATMNTQTNELSEQKTEVDASSTEQILAVKKSKNDVSNASTPVAQKDLAEDTIITSGEVPAAESFTDVNHSEPEKATSSREIYSDSESTSPNVTTQSVTPADNNVYSDSESTSPNVTTQSVTPADNNVYSDVQHDTTDCQCVPAETASNDAVNKVTKEEKVQSAHFPRIVLVKRKPRKQDTSRKSSGKLAIILQRLNAERDCTKMLVAPKCSIPNDSNILTKSSLSEAEAVINQSHSSESTKSSLSEAEAVINQSHSSESTKSSLSEAEAVINQSHSSESSSAICAETVNKEQAVPQYSFKQISSSTTDNSPLLLPQISQNSVSQKNKVTFKLSPQTTSSADKHHEKSATNSSKAQASESKLTKSETIPLKIVKKSESVQSGSQNRSNEPTNMFLLHSKPSLSSLKKGSQVFRVSGTVKEPKKYITSAEATPIASLGQQTLTSTDKGKYVLGFVSLKGSSACTKSLESKGHSPSVGTSVESDPKPSNMQTVTSKSKHQFSLLQPISPKHPVSVNTSDFSKVPTIYSLLANSPATSISSSKPSKHSIIESPGVNTPTSNLLSPVVMQDITKPAFAQCSGPNRLILASHNAGQICFQSVPYAAVTSSNPKSSKISNRAAAVLKNPKVKASISPNALTSTPSKQPAVIVMPTPTAGTTLSTFLAISTSGYSQSDIPAAITTVSKISAATTKAKTVKTAKSSTATSSTANPELSLTNQHSTDSFQSCSTLITKIAQRSLSHTLENRPAVDIQTNLAPPLDTAVKPQLAQEISKPTSTLPSSCRIIVSRDSGIRVAINSGSLQAEDSSSTKDTTSDKSGFKMYAADALTVSKLLQALNVSQTSVGSKPSKTSEISKIAQTSVVIPVINSNNACTPTPSRPNPVKVTASCPTNIPSVRLLPQTFKLVMPVRKAVSLLNISSTPKIQHHIPDSVKSSTNVSNATETQVRRKLKPMKSIRKRIFEQNIGQMSSATSSIINPSLSVETTSSIPRKTRENATYSATVRTGQGPVSVIVVAPDLEDDSSDTLSDTGISKFRSAVQSQPDNEDARGLGNAEKLSRFKSGPEQSCSSNQDVIKDTATCREDNLPYKLSCSETGVLDLKCHEELETSSQDNQSRFPGVDDAGSDTLSDTEISRSRFSKEAETSDHGCQHRSASLDEEETDSDLDIINAEEQDMSVLRQLLIGTDSAGTYAVTGKQLQKENSLMSGKANDITNRQWQLELDMAHETHLTACLEKSEHKLPNKTGSIQQLLIAPFAPIIQNHVPDQIVKQQPEDSDVCGLKIESIFSLSSNADLEEPEFSKENYTQENIQEFPDDHSLVFNVRDSPDWKNYVIPCFVVLVRLPKSEMLAKGRCDIQSKCSEHCRKRTLDYLCNLNLLKCVNHPEAASFLKPKRRVAVKRSLGKFVKHQVVRKEMSVSETVVESAPLYPPLLGELKQELSYELDIKPSLSLLNPITEDTTETSVISKADHYEKNLSLEQDGEKEENTMSPGLDLITSSPDLRKFLTGLKQLKKQVVRKRAKMLNQKLTRKTKDTPLVKSKTKLVENKPHSLPLTKKVHASTKKIKYTPANRTMAAEKMVIENISSTKHHADYLPNTSSGILRHNSSKKNGKASKELASFVKKYKIRRSGVLPMPANTTEQASKVPIPKLKTGANVVSIQPKMQPLPEEKVKAALQSLNSYLEATGKRPTVGNTQYILLKIDDQHILVKLPFTSASTALLNNVTLSNLKTVPATSSINQALLGGGASGHTHLQMQSELNIAKTIANAATASNMNTATTAQTVANMKSALQVLKTACNTASSKIINSSNTSSLVPGKAKRKKITKPIMRNNSSTGSKGILEKTYVKHIGSFISPQHNLDQIVSSVEKPAVNVYPNLVHSSFITSGTYSSVTSSLAHPAIISLLRPIAPSQSQSSKSARTSVYQMKNVSSTTIPPVPFNISSYAASDSSMKTSSGEPSTVLSNLPPNSSLLPEHKRKSAALSEKAREHKRRRLEAKYPLPPGIVIKSEPDDSDYGLSTKWTETSGAADNGSFHVMYTEHTLDKELPGGMYSQDQALSVSKPIKTGSLLPKTAGQGLEKQDSIRNVSVMNIPAHSPSDMEEMLSAEPNVNIEDSSDELDEPPALLDETADDDDMEESIQTFDIVNTKEDMPPVLQPMFTSSCSCLVEDTDLLKIDNTGFTKEKPIYMEDLTPNGTKNSNKAADSISGTSIYSEGSLDSGIDSNIPSNSSSYTSVKYFSTPATERSICKNLKIQHLKELLKKKEMEIENMKKLRTEFPSLDLDHI